MVAQEALVGTPPIVERGRGSTRRSRALAALVAVCLSAVGLILAGPAHAATTPPWEPDPNSVGSLSFFDASGNVITSGRTDVAPFAAYVAGSKTIRSGDKSAAVYFANPQPGKTPVGFFREQVGTFTAYPTTSAAASINTISRTRPVNTGDSGDQSLDGFETDSAVSTTAGYQNVVQVRLRTADAAGQIGVPYESADVMIDPATHTWTQLYPTPSSAPDASALAITAPASIRYGYTATITGKLTDTTTATALAAQRITLYGRHGKTGSWSALKTVTTTSTGAASVGLKPTSYEQFYWRYAGTTGHGAVSSAVKAVSVSQVVSAKATATKVKAKSLIKVYGTIAPAGSGQRVYLQVYGHGWKNVTSAVIKSQTLPNHKRATGFVLGVKPAKGSKVYRVYKQATSTLTAGVSGQFHLAGK